MQAIFFLFFVRFRKDNILKDNKAIAMAMAFDFRMIPCNVDTFNKSYEYDKAFYLLYFFDDYICKFIHLVITTHFVK